MARTYDALCNGRAGASDCGLQHDAFAKPDRSSDFGVEDTPLGHRAGATDWVRVEEVVVQPMVEASYAQPHYRGPSNVRDVPTLWEQFKDALVSNQNFEYIYWIQVSCR